jgi:hypothetical protein
MESITKTLGALNHSELPPANPDQNPLDIFRLHIAGRLSAIANVSLNAVFEGLDRSVKPEAGDLVLAIPRLRIEDSNPRELGEKWIAEVFALSTAWIN